MAEDTGMLVGLCCEWMVGLLMAFKNLSQLGTVLFFFLSEEPG